MTSAEKQAIVDEARQNVERLASLPKRTATSSRDDVSEHRPRLDTLPTNVSAAIAAAITSERGRLHLLLNELVTAIRAEVDDALAQIREIGAARQTKLAGLVDQLHSLRVENANLRADFAELRASLAVDRGGDQPARRQMIIN
jgi:hypothetical protein